MDDPLSWIIIIICLIACLFFSISETALSCCNRFKIQVEAGEGSFITKVINHLINRYNQSLAATLMGNNSVSLAASAVCTALFIRYFQGTTLESFASLIATLLITILIFIFGDGLAKTIGKAIPDTISKIIAIPLLIIFYLFYPLTFLFDLLMKALDKLFKKDKQDQITEDDLGDIIENMSDEGMIEEEQGEIIQSALEFDDTKVQEVFTKKENMSMIDIKNLSHSYLQDYLLKHTYSRIPIYQRDENNIIGILIVKNYLKEYAKDQSFNIKRILQRPYFVTKSMMIDDIFLGFKRKHTHLAIVRDSAKNVIGMITMEDVLEEIVSGISEKSFVKVGKK